MTSIISSLDSGFLSTVKTSYCVFVVFFVLLSSFNTQAAASKSRQQHQSNDKMMKAMPDFVKGPLAEHTASLIFMHGLGDTGEGWSQILSEELGPSLPYVKMIFPNAPVQPITLNGGMAMPGWYDIVTLDKEAPDAEDLDGLAVSVERIQKMIDAEIDAGIPANRIVLGGFSQGGCVALSGGLGYKRGALAGVAGLSTYLMGRSTWSPAEEQQQIPVWMAHGTADPVVLPQWGQATYDIVKSKVPGASWSAYPGMQHSSCAQEMYDFKAWLQRVVPPVVTEPEVRRAANAKGALVFASGASSQDDVKHWADRLSAVVHGVSIVVLPGDDKDAVEDAVKSEANSTPVARIVLGGVGAGGDAALAAGLRWKSGALGGLFSLAGEFGAQTEGLRPLSSVTDTPVGLFHGASKGDNVELMKKVFNVSDMSKVVTSVVDEDVRGGNGFHGPLAEFVGDCLKSAE